MSSAPTPEKLLSRSSHCGLQRTPAARAIPRAIPVTVECAEQSSNLSVEALKLNREVQQPSNFPEARGEGTKVAKVSPPRTTLRSTAYTFRGVMADWWSAGKSGFPTRNSVFATGRSVLTLCRSKLRQGLPAAAFRAEVEGPRRGQSDALNRPRRFRYGRLQPRCDLVVETREESDSVAGRFRQRVETSLRQPLTKPVIVQCGLWTEIFPWPTGATEFS